jgi:phosphoglycerate dehydrogenase-like enzyme
MASLDVVEPEPLPAGHALYTHPNVRVSPHISWSSPDTIQRTIEIFAENLKRHDAGEPLQGIIDVKEGY